MADDRGTAWSWIEHDTIVVSEAAARSSSAGSSSFGRQRRRGVPFRRLTRRESEPDSDWAGARSAGSSVVEGELGW